MYIYRSYDFNKKYIQIISNQTQSIYMGIISNRLYFKHIFKPFKYRFIIKTKNGKYDVDLEKLFSHVTSYNLHLKNINDTEFDPKVNLLFDLVDVYNFDIDDNNVAAYLKLAYGLDYTRIYKAKFVLLIVNLYKIITNKF